MIKINERFTIERYQFGWELHETKKGQSREGKQIDVVTTTFYATLPGIINSILDKTAGRETITELKGILLAFEQIQKEIIESIDMAGIKELCKVDKYVRSDEVAEEDEEVNTISEEEDDETEVIQDTITTIQRRKL